MNHTGYMCGRQVAKCASVDFSPQPAAALDLGPDTVHGMETVGSSLPFWISNRIRMFPWHVIAHPCHNFVADLSNPPFKLRDR